MALVRLAPIVSMIRGSVGGVTFSRTLGGDTLSSRTNGRQTPGHRAPFDTMATSRYRNWRRANLTVISYHWLNALSQAERDAWNALALDTRLINAVGAPMQTTGRALFIRTNTITGLFGEPIIEAAPARAVVQIPEVEITWNAADSDFDLDINADFLDAADRLFTWISAPWTYTRNADPSVFYLDSATDIDLFPITITTDGRGLPWTLCMAYFFRLRLSAKDGALSHPIVIRAISD